MLSPIIPCNQTNHSRYSAPTIRIPMKAISIMLQYAACEHEKICLIAIFMANSLIYVDENEKPNNSIREAIKTYLCTEALQDKKSVVYYSRLWR